MYKLIITMLISVMMLEAQDTIKVQTLTFDDIYARRGVWTFPDNPDEFRKVLMSYTLKCDPKTPHDRFNCGEWDYLTYTTVHKHTGIMDSSLQEHPRFMLARTSPDTIKYSHTPQFTEYYITKKAKVFDDADAEYSYSEFDVSNEESEIIINTKHSRLQFFIDRNTLKDSDLDKKISRLKIKTNLPEGAVLNNVIIRAELAVAPDFSNLNNGVKTVLYDYKVTADEDGTLDFLFNEDFAFNPLRGVLFDIAIENHELYEFAINTVQSGGSLLLKSKDNDGLNDFYLKFDGTYDFMETDINQELSDVSEFTVEGWFRVDEWKNWIHLFGKGGRTGIELGPEEGQIYCMVRSLGNTHGNVKQAVQLGKWFHLAMVFDGSKEHNADKLKLYIDGFEKGLIYNGTIPSKTEINDIPFTISSLRHNTSAFKGGADNIRVWSKSLTSEEIISRMYLDDLSDEPDSEFLIANYIFNSTNENMDDLEENYNIALYGKPLLEEKVAANLTNESLGYDYQPAVMITEYENPVTTDITDIEQITEEVKPAAIYEYAVDNYVPHIINQEIVWLEGYQYNYDEEGNIADSVYYPAEEILVNEIIEYYSEPAEEIINYEIGRFITPYGINLDLGPEGFEWMYDVTDYASLLTGEVDLSAGNLQELIDLKFYFIKGTPPRKVEEITQIWGPRKSYRYSDLDNDVVLNEKEISLNPDARQFKVITRLTGHGHHSNDGSYPHCCEWIDNSHYLYVNSEKVADWKIFRYTECGENPVFPQGGTWPGAREGWCPGDIVYDYEYEVTDYISGETATFDYDITDVPANNQGMGNGNYIVAMHLIQYSESEFETDAEIYDVIAPNSWDYYSRKNPICLDPQFKIRNNGKSNINSMKISYMVSGGEKLYYDWKGNIAPHEIQTIDIPLSSSDFWLGDGGNVFTLEIVEVNGSADDYAENNINHTDFNMPDLFEGPVVIVYKTNQRASHFTYQIYDSRGEYVSNLKPNMNNREYRDTISAADECLTFKLTDQYSQGLSYWANQNQGSGYLRIEDLDGNLLKSFNPDFGRGVYYSFRTGDVSYVQDMQTEYLMELYPNPVQETATVKSTFDMGNTDIKIYDLIGNKITEFTRVISNGTEIEIDVSGYSTGDYFIEFNNGRYRFTKRFLKK